LDLCGIISEALEEALIQDLAARSFGCKTHGFGAADNFGGQDQALTDGADGGNDKVISIKKRHMPLFY